MAPLERFPIYFLCRQHPLLGSVHNVLWFYSKEERKEKKEKRQKNRGSTFHIPSLSKPLSPNSRQHIRVPSPNNARVIFTSSLLCKPQASLSSGDYLDH